MDVAESLEMWWRDLERRVVSRWDLLLHIAHRNLRHPPADAPDEEVDANTLAQQKAEALRLLRQQNPT